MEPNKISRIWEQGHTVQVEALDGVIFTGEADAHTFAIAGKDATGAAIPITGTITAKFLSSAQVTTPLTGTITDGIASVTLTDDCYKIPGRFVLTIYATNGNSTICIYAGVGNVFRSASDIISYPTETLPDLVQLVADVQAAISSVPADYSAVLAAMASTFDSTKAYASGAYAWYNGVLYRFTTDHAAGAWIGTDATRAVLGSDISDLKSALLYTSDEVTNQQINVLDPNAAEVGYQLYFASGYNINTLRARANCATTKAIKCKPDDVITVFHNALTSGGVVTSDRHGIVFANDSGEYIDYILFSNLPDNYTESFTVPSGATQFRVTFSLTYAQLKNLYITINRGTLDQQIPFGIFAVPQAQENLLGGIKARTKTNKDTTEVVIDNPTGKLYVNLLDGDNRILYIPKKAYTDGTTKRIPIRNFSWSRNPNSMYFRSPTANTQNTARVMPNYWSFITGGNAADKRSAYPIDIFAFDAETDSQIGSGRTINNVVRPLLLDNPSSAKNLLLIGDSFVNNNIFPDRVKARLTEYGLSNIVMVGTKQTDAGNKYTAYGGHGYYDFVTNPSDLPSGHVNPFWNPNTGEVDFTYFASVCNVSAFDYVIIHLGINDLLDNISTAQIIAYMQTFVGAIHSAFPSCVVVCDGLVIPSMDCPSHYNPIDRAKTILEYNLEFEAAVDAIANTYYAPVNTFFDAEYAYPYVMQTPVEGSSEQVKVLTDYLHPYTPGYYQIADEALWCLLYNASEL